MYTIINNLKNNQSKVFLFYYMIVFILISWSYYEGIGNISGVLIYQNGEKGYSSLFKAGYLSSLNYGIYYLIGYPFFLRFVFETYSTAEELTSLTGEREHDNLRVYVSIRQYSSNIIMFLQKRYSVVIFSSLLLLFCYQSLIVEKDNYKNLSLGWVQGLLLKNAAKNNSVFVLKKKFYFRNNNDSSYVVKEYDQVKISKIYFSSSRIPKEREFLFFLIFAKVFFSLFEAIVFFFNFNMLYGLVKFFQEPDKEYLFKSEKFIEIMNKLVSNISLSGFFLSIFLLFRYIANSQKGTFRPFNPDNPFSSDHYMFLLGMIFIPITAIILFNYLYINNQVVDLKKLTLRNIITFYFPNILFFTMFFVYFINFDPFMENQLPFVRYMMKFINKVFLG